MLHFLSFLLFKDIRERVNVFLYIRGFYGGTMNKSFFEVMIGIQEFKDRIFRIFSSKSRIRTHKKSGTYFTTNETLSIRSLDKQKAENVSITAKKVLKNFINNPEGILKFIESKGTKVIRAKHIEKVLILLGDEEGFICPKKGGRALFFSIMINILSSSKIGIGFKTPAMFVMSTGEINIYYLAHQFHHWVAYAKGLPGYEEETIDNFKNLWNPEFGSNDVSKMSIDEILSLKDAIARDVEAIKFVKEISRELIGTRNSIKRLKNGESLNL